jgi:hypothetical protein
MPENNHPISKAQAIRDYLIEHPDTPPLTVAKTLTSRGIQVSPGFVSTVKTTMRPTTPRSDSGDDLLVKLGKAQVNAMFRRQDDYPVDDFEFLPLMEAVLTAFETTGIDQNIVEAVWEYAFHVYDQACKKAVPESTTIDNRRLMQDYLLGKRRKAGR